MIFGLIIPIIFFTFISETIAYSTTERTDSEVYIENFSTNTLNYNGSVQKHGSASESITWSFESSKSYIDITVYAMTDEEYAKITVGGYIFYTLSSGASDEDDGTWTVPFSDTWYIVFINWDSNKETTTLTYDAEFDPSDFFEDNLYIFMVVGVIVFVAVCAGVSKSQQQAKLARQQTTSTPQSPYKIERAREPAKSELFSELDSKPAEPAKPAASLPKPAEPKTGPSKYCYLCGEKLDFDAEFCHSCGSKVADLSKL